MKTMISSFGNAVLSREQMKVIIGGAEATAQCDSTFSVTCTGGTQCNQTSGSKGGCSCQDNSGTIVSEKHCILQ